MKVDRVRGGSDAVFAWLGSMSPGWYYTLSSIFTVILLVLLHCFSINPIWQRVSEERDASRELKAYDARKLKLLAQIHSNRRDATLHERHPAMVEDEATNELILERIHRSAGEAGVVITDFSERHSQVQFTAQGAFSQIRNLLNLLSDNETRFVTSSVVVENVKWPDFDGQLQLCVVVVSGPQD
jgi:hypothetical protein